MKETIKPDVEVKKASITTFQVEAIVNPANSSGFMGGGVAGVIKKVGGLEIEDEIINLGPVPIGEARITESGALVCEKIIHAPTMENPVEKTDSHKVLCAVVAALELADEQGIKSIAIPGMGTGVGRLDKKEAARIIIKAIKDFEFKSIEKIFLIDIDDEMIKAFEKAKEEEKT